LTQLRHALDEYAVLVIRDQKVTTDDLLEFGQRFDGDLRHRNTGAALRGDARQVTEALTEISNLDSAGRILSTGDARRIYSLANRMWHTDSSFQHPPGRCSMLLAGLLPPWGGETEFTDTRAAYESLDSRAQDQLEPLQVFHSIAFSRATIGIEFT